MRFLPFLLLASLALAQRSGPVRPVPPPGVEVPAADRKDLEGGLKRLAEAMAPFKNHPDYADIAIFHEAVRYAAHLRRILQDRRDLQSQGTAEARTDAGRRTRGRPALLEHGDRTGAARLHLEDRPQRAAILDHRAARVCQGSGACAAAGLLGAWPWRDAERSELSLGPSAPARRVGSQGRPISSTSMAASATRTNLPAKSISPRCWPT